MWTLVRRRVSVSMDYLGFGTIAAMVTVITITFLGECLALKDGESHVQTETTFIIVTSLFLLRFWPFIMVPFIYSGVSRWSPIIGANVWKGPGILAAWRLTGNGKVFLRLSLPMACFLVLVIILNVWCSEQFGIFSRVIILYMISLPIVVAMNAAFIQEIALFDALWEHEDKGEAD